MEAPMLQSYAHCANLGAVVTAVGLSALGFVLISLVIGFDVYLLSTGIMYQDECPIQPLLPIFLIGLGICRFIRVGCAFLLEERNVYLKAINTFIHIWFSLGVGLVVQIYPPNYDEVDSDYYCNKKLYHISAFYISAILCLAFMERMYRVVFYT
uniref:Uncharacterized protein n=1 Tax=Strigamia maritima TaxID=126957 RepID=T1JNX8_STRMM